MISLEERKKEEMDTDEKDDVYMEIEDNKDLEKKDEENTEETTTGRQPTSDEDDTKSMETDQDLLQPPGMEVNSSPVKDLISKFEMLININLQGK